MRRFSIVYIPWALLFIVLPLALIVLISFNGASGMNVDNFHFSLDQYRRFLQPMYLNILARSISLAAKATAICLLLGYPAAYSIARLRPKASQLMIMLFIIPMWMNFLLRTYAWITLLGRGGVINRLLGLIGLGPFDMMYNQGAILMGMIYNFLPFMVLPIYTILQKMDRSLIEAAFDLGASPIQTFSRIILPLSLPGIVSGVMMCFIPALSTFVISALLGGNKYYLIGNIIEQQFKLTGNWPFGAAMAVVLIVILLATLGVVRGIERMVEKGGGHGK